MKNDSGKSSNGKTDVKGNIKRLKVTGGLAALLRPRCLLWILTCIFNVFYPPDTLGPPGPGCWGSRRRSTPGSSHGRRSKVCHRFSRRCPESAGSARTRALRGPEAHQQSRDFSWAVVRLKQITDRRRRRTLTVEPPGVVLLRADGRAAPHGPEQSRVRAHEVYVDASVQVPIWSQQVSSCLTSHRWRSSPLTPHGGLLPSRSATFSCLGS